LQEWETKRYNSANLGTQLHEQIENYYNGLPYNKELPEFQHFLKFKEKYATMVPYRSEWRIFDEEYLIAGTIDMVYQKEGDELYMFDWKRSEKVVNAQGKLQLPSYDYASGELSHLSDNSYNRYAIQQNIYKYILEKHYNKKISSMNLLILHPSFDTYHHIKLPDLTEEVKYIFENSKHYR
jgi:ATP-dependent exoDNAse (exonuclease V) beta subunit